MKDELTLDALVLPEEFSIYVAEISMTDMLLHRHLTGRDGDHHDPINIVRNALLRELRHSHKLLAKQAGK